MPVSPMRYAKREKGYIVYSIGPDGKDDGVKEEEFDMVVLSIGLNPSVDCKGLSETFGIELNSHGFSRACQENLMATTRPGTTFAVAAMAPAAPCVRSPRG